MRFYQFNIGDYASHTRHLTPLEDIAYRRLLDLYYLHEKPLTGDLNLLCRQIGMRGNEAEVDAVRSEFFEETPEGWINHRADSEIAKYREQVEGAKRGAAARWAKGGDAPGNAPGNAPPMPPAKPPHSEGNAEGNATPLGQGQQGAMLPITNTHTQVPSTKKQGAKREAPDTDIDLPDCIPASKWVEWIAYRRQRRLSVTPLTMDKQVESLVGWHAQGHDPGDIIDTSIRNGWQGLFEPKAAPKARQAALEARNQDAVDTAYRELFGGDYVPE